MTVSLEYKKINWIHSFGSEKPKQTYYKGKWLSFIPVEYADAVWKKIDIATSNNKLGFHSKMSSPIVFGYNSKLVCVLCIYTYDCHDPEDVLRVREHLRQLGFIRKIKYVCKGMYFE